MSSVANADSSFRWISLRKETASALPRRRYLSRRRATVSSLTLSCRCCSPTATGVFSSAVGVCNQRFNTSRSTSDNFLKEETHGPWLMLSPDATKGLNCSSYHFYSLAEDRIISIDKNKAAASSAPDDDVLCTGSSHGWLVFLNKRGEFDLFLSDPITGRNVKLPSIRTLPLYDNCIYNVHRVVLSSPEPDSEGCRAVVIYYGGDPEGEKLAFCSPGKGDTAWTCLDKLPSPRKAYNSNVVYSNKDQIFYWINDYSVIEAWDLRDSCCPKMVLTINYKEDLDIVIDNVDSSDEDVHHEDERFGGLYQDSGNEDERFHAPYSCTQRFFLAVAPWSGQLYLIERYVVPYVDEDGSVVDPEECEDVRYFPYKTRKFYVYKLDLRKKLRTLLTDSLENLAFFIGSNQSFVLSAEYFPELKPNSVYFTDDSPKVLTEYKWLSYGGHDIGIYNYKDKTFEPCYYPCDFKNIRRILPSPIWFTPNVYSK